MNQGQQFAKQDFRSNFEIQDIQQRIKSKSRNQIQSKGPVKASYEIPQENWKMKYEYRSPKTVQGLKSKKQKNLEESSDYGTMSRADRNEQILVDTVPYLNLNDNHESNGAFNDISIEDRKERITSILDEILSIPRLVEANITQRSLKSNSAMSKFLTSDKIVNSHAGSRASRVDSKQSTSRSRQGEQFSSRSKQAEQFLSRPKQFEQRLKRSVSTPKLDLISEGKTLNKGRNVSKKSGTMASQSGVPKLNLNLNSSSKSSLPDIGKVRQSKTDEDLSAEFLPSRKHAMQSLIPNLGDETRNELAFSAPTLGDDTTHLDEDDTFDMNEKTQESINFVKTNMNIDIPKKDLNTVTGRSSVASSIAPKHKTGSVPKYLKARQAKWAEDAAQLEAAIPDPDCPPGHVKLNDEERVNQLGQMTTKHADLLQDLHRLPVSSDTRRVVLKRQEIEGLLVWVEQEIRKYSRSKVFVPAN
eukprot:GFUD01053658.1.p1 GENE.GFUD01053658.1~~GFUD01053658.1.p1  ORF type:complete len:472 (-),score=121.85 GFUD01053658.1:30-1445(-)